MRITSLLISLTLVATASQAKSQDLSLLEMPELGLVINHPKNWQVTTVRKSADLKVAIPIEGSSQKAQLELYNIAFNSEKDVWQLGQKAINDRMKREIMRQWEEEFLGVPMLLTKVSFVDKEGPQILLTGLIYSRTGKKMMFRLAASPDDFDKAEFVWREAMNTIRTGKPWAPEDPNLKPDPKAPPRTQLPPPVVTRPKSLDTEIKSSKPPIAIAMSVSGQKLEVRIPGEWTGKVDENGVLTLTHPEIPSTIKLVLASSLDSDPPRRALLLTSSKSLETYQKVSKRDETIPTKNRAGALVSSVWRSGTNEQGDLFSCDAVTVSGDYYFVLNYRSVNTSRIGLERKIVENLLQNSTIELIP